jgi:Protein of unknown function (DUF4231)
VVRRKGKAKQAAFLHDGVATVLAGAAIPVVNLWAIKDAYLAGVLSAIFGGVVVVVAAISKLFKFHDNWLHYRARVEALAREKELCAAGAGDYAAIPLCIFEHEIADLVERETVRILVSLNGSTALHGFTGM